MSNRCHNFQVDSSFKIDEISTNFPRGVSTSNRWQIDEDVSIGNLKRMQSNLHEIGTYDIFKISLSCFDCKRYVLDDGRNILAYFHKDIKNL